MLTESILKKKQIKVMTKDQIRKSALIELRLRGVNCWRQNNIAVRGRTFIGRKGVADIMGFNSHTGLIVACEIKTINDTIKPDQKVFLTEVKQAGGIAMIATQELNQVVLKPWIP